MSVSGKRVTLILVGAVLVTTLLTPLLPHQAYASNQLEPRSLTLEPSGSNGGSQPGVTVKHLFSFTTTANETLGSVNFQYCTTASGTCTIPHGLVTTSATLSNQTGATGFTINNSTNGAPYITRTAAAFTAGAATYEFSNVTNTDGTDCGNAIVSCTFYVRITTYSAAALGGSVNDTGTVAASVNTQIVLTGTMPESLIFCTGGSVTTNSGGIPDCSTATSGNISFNQLFSPADTATAKSQMAASTNANNGYQITYQGATLTSGSNTITALTGATGTTPTRGLSQFGLNLRANTVTTSTPAIGSDVAPAANGTNFKGQPVVGTGYDTVDKFKFIAGSAQAVADSANGGTAGPSDAQIYTVSYIVNVSGGQPIGTYTTTLTYVCTATF